MDTTNTSPRHDDLITQIEQHLLTPQTETPPRPELTAAAELLAADPVRASRFWRYDNQLVTGADVATHLTTARDTIGHEGWTQGKFAIGGLCARAALQTAIEAKAGTEATGYVARSCLNLILRSRGEHRDVINWNDTRGRTRAEVLDLFTDAADFAHHYGPATSHPLASPNDA